MRPLRLVFITRRYWPLVGGAEMVMANLAEALDARGHEVTLLTAAWNADWPREIQHRGTRVVRIPQSPRRFHGTWQYMRGLKNWLTENRSQYDLVYVSMLKHDAYVAVRMGQKLEFPVVLRAEGGGATGDATWQRTQRFGSLIRRHCRQACAVVAPSPAIEQELLSLRYPAERLHCIANGVGLFPERDAAGRRAAREALGTAHAVLSLGGATRLVVYTGRLSEEKGLDTLIDAWALVVREHANTRLWLVGEGPLRDALAAQIERLHIRGRCVLVGSFDSVEELLAAADVYVLPSREEGLSVALLEAMASGLPIVATDIPGNRTLLEHGTHGLLTPPDDAAAMARAIVTLLENPAEAARYGAAARERAQASFSLGRMVELHERLFCECLSPT